VARGDHLAAPRERGLRLRTPAEDITQHLPAIECPEEIDGRSPDDAFLRTKPQKRPISPCSAPIRGLVRRFPDALTPEPRPTANFDRGNASW
jgi:hypothetical protein